MKSALGLVVLVTMAWLVLWIFNFGVLVYSADESSEPQVLPTLLTPSLVLDALDKAAKGSKPSMAKK